MNKNAIIREKRTVIISDPDSILNLDTIDIPLDGITQIPVYGFQLSEGTDIRDILRDNEKTVLLKKADKTGPTLEEPLKININLSTGDSSSSVAVEMQKIVIRVPSECVNSQVGIPLQGILECLSLTGEKVKVAFGEGSTEKNVELKSLGRSIIAPKGDIIIDFGYQVPVTAVNLLVSKISGDRSVVEIEKVEFLNNAWKEAEDVDLNVPIIKNVTTSTEVNNESIKIDWEPQENITGYEVKYEKLNEKGRRVSIKKFQTRDTTMNILDKNIKPYDTYRVSVQSINNKWQSGYKTEDIDNFSIVRIQILPEKEPEAPRNLTIKPGAKSFTVNWDENKRAKFFDLYYRKIENEEGKWEKANKTGLIQGNSFKLKQLEDNAYYEVKVTATNHLGESGFSEICIASTKSTLVPDISQFNLINRGGNIIDISEDGTETTFNDEYLIGTISFSKIIENRLQSISSVKISYFDLRDNVRILTTRDIIERTSNGQTYNLIKLATPIKAKRIKIEMSGVSVESISEFRFYEYDSTEHDIGNLYTDDLRIALKQEVTMDLLEDLENQLETPDPINGQFNPDKEILLSELNEAKMIVNNDRVRRKIIKLHTNISSVGIGISNMWQSLGSVARPGKMENGSPKRIVVYLRSSDPKVRVDICFMQTFGSQTRFESKITRVAPGRTEIEIPTIIDVDSEKGGAVMARIIGGNKEIDVELRLLQTIEIPHLSVKSMKGMVVTEDLMKGRIYDYINYLKDYVDNIQRHYPKTVKDYDKLNNIYLYDEKTSVLNITEIEGEKFTLSLPATEILKAINEGLEDNKNAMVTRVYDAFLAWEQQITLAYAKKGVFREVLDFNENGTIDNEDILFQMKNKAPEARLSIKYQRMPEGHTAYASGQHIGVDFDCADYIKGVPYRFNKNGHLINAESAKLYKPEITNEIGRVIDISSRVFEEVSNTLITVLGTTMLGGENLYGEDIEKVYEKVTSNTLGLFDRSTQFFMLWQPYLAYENQATFKMLTNDLDANLKNDSYFARLNRLYRSMTKEEKEDGDKEQWLIRMTSKVVERDLSDFYKAYGIEANDTTKEFVSKFPKETRKIQYMNDEARMKRMVGNASMKSGTTVSADFMPKKGKLIRDGEYVDSEIIPLKMSVSDSTNILGFEILRNGIPCAFILKDKDSDETTFEDNLKDMTNRVAKYSIVAYDYALNSTEPCEIGSIKIRITGKISKENIKISTNTFNVKEKSDFTKPSYVDVYNSGLNKVLDSATVDGFEGRMLSGDEFNSDIHKPEMNPGNKPYFIFDVEEKRSLLGLKYSAPILEEKSRFGSKKKESLAETTLEKYKVEVSIDGKEWVVAKEGTLNLTIENPSSIIYFDKRVYEDNTQESYVKGRYIRLSSLNRKDIGAESIEVFTPKGDNIELGVNEDNKEFGKEYINPIGLLEADYRYISSEEDEEGKEITSEKVIPEGSLVIVGEFKGNPRITVPLVLNQKNEYIKYNHGAIVLSETSHLGKIGAIAEGIWVSWIDPDYVVSFMTNNKQISAALYRTDTVGGKMGAQRLTSDTIKVNVPASLPKVNLKNMTKKLNPDLLKGVEVSKKLLVKTNKNR